MTPERRAEFEKLVDALVAEARECQCARCELRGGLAFARAALTAFVEREEGEVFTVFHAGNFVLEMDTDEEAVSLRYRVGDRVRVVKEGA